MIRIRFQDSITERKALGWLAGRYSFRTFASGETEVPVEAMSALQANGFSFVLVNS